MIRTFSFGLAVLVLSSLQIGCAARTPKTPPGKLPLTRESRTEPTRSLDELSAVIKNLAPMIGEYPPRFASPQQKETVYKVWSDAFVDAKYYLDNAGNAERVLWTMAELAREGHNMDVDGTGVLAQEVIEKCLTNFPRSVQCHFSAADYYIAIRVSGESMAALNRSLTFLRQKYAPKANQYVEERFVYLYAYDHQPQLAIQQIDRYLKLFPKSPKRAEFRRMKKELKSEPT
ncbi:MAG: hypothetical protein U0136_03440 [Bdellovibrionota bacterium]